MAGIIDVDGLDAVTVALQGESIAAAMKASTVVRTTALEVVATAQDFVPVDTGATKNSIHASGPEGQPLASASLEAEIGPTTEYAPDLEWGTIHMAPHAFMGPALDRHTPGFVEALSNVPGLFR